MKRIILVGATGSIGRQTLDVLERHPDRFTIVAMSAHSSAEALRSCARAYPSATLCLSGSSKPLQGIHHYGAAGLASMIHSTDADLVLNAAAGSDGLEVSFAALQSGKDLALANKESIVMAGRLVLEMAKTAGKRVLPVDSEHSAIFNMMERFGRQAVREVILTASGGAFRDLPAEKLETVTPEDALAHPTWNMGKKITIDSASMANKGLEVIEAARLFDCAPGNIQVLIHPESRVHSFIRTRDGSLYAQISRPDMRLPILNALSWPDMYDETAADLDTGSLAMTFRQPDYGRYPLLRLAYDALREGEGATVAYNAANEVAVEAFVTRHLSFTGIAQVVERTLEAGWRPVMDNLQTVRFADSEARRLATLAIRSKP